MNCLGNKCPLDQDNPSRHLWILDLNPANEIDAISYSIQPNHGPETRYHACLPSLGLRNLVSYYYQVHASEEAKDKCIYPSGNIALVFRCDPLNPDIYLVGTPTVPRLPEYIEKQLDYFIVFFCIGEGADLTSAPASELVDTHVPIGMLCLDEAEMIAEDIARSKTFMERVRCFERYMGCQKNIVHKPRGLLKPVIQAICGGAHTDTQKRFDQISDRHLRRLFNRYVGVSPTYFKRMIRHQKAIKALNLNPYQDLAGLSAKLGYCDQSHFIHEFKRFHGVPPVKFLRTYIRTE